MTGVAAVTVRTRFHRARTPCVPAYSTSLTDSSLSSGLTPAVPVGHGGLTFMGCVVRCSPSALSA